MRILFVNCVDRPKEIQIHHYPLAFGYLISYCNKFGEFFDYYYTEQLSEAVLQSFKPDVVALTCVTENYNMAKRYAHLAKKKAASKVVIGGVHVSAVPHTLTQDMDMGVIGEGEETFLELVRSNFVPNNKIKGIVYHEDNRLVKSEDRNLIEPLDLIPHPRRDIFGSEKREQHIFTSRGCPYRCIFCFSSRFWKKVRFHSAEYVAEEIKDIKEKFKVSHITIYDDNFILDLDRLKHIRDFVKDLKLTYSIAARANLITDEVVAVLKDMGVINIGIGFESNSQRVLDYLRKGNTVKDNQNAANVIRKFGLNLSGSFIRGIPIETKDDVKLTYKFIRENSIPCDMYRLMRFPGTPIYDGCEDWDSFKVHCIRSYPEKRRRAILTLKTAVLKALVKTKLNDKVVPLWKKIAQKSQKE